MLPLCVLMGAGADDAMRIWMGISFAANSHRVVEIIAVGIFANSIAQLPFAWLQASGYARLTGQLQVAELPIYVFGLYVSVAEWGILGVAWMWSVRALMDCLLLMAMAGRRGARMNCTVLLAAILLIAVIGFVTGPALRWEWRPLILATSAAATVAGAWFGAEFRGSRTGSAPGCRPSTQSGTENVRKSIVHRAVLRNRPSVFVHRLLRVILGNNIAVITNS